MMWWERKDGVRMRCTVVRTVSCHVNAVDVTFTEIEVRQEPEADGKDVTRVHWVSPSRVVSD